jgi:hypothetical protein
MTVMVNHTTVGTRYPESRGKSHTSGLIRGGLFRFVTGPAFVAEFGVL